LGTFAVLQLTGCAGCEVSLLNALETTDDQRPAYMPLIISSEDIPDVETLLVTGAVRTEHDLYRLRHAARKAQRIVAVGTCAISGGVANLGDRDDVREMFFRERSRRHVPPILPKLQPVDAIVPVTLYLPGCPPTPELFLAAIGVRTDLEPPKTVCLECGRKRTRDRPAKLRSFQERPPDPNICLINQGYLCVGSATRGGCGAPCTRAGHPCVGCRGPSDGFITRSSDVWFQAIKRVFARMTDIPEEAIDEAIRSPQLALFVFQFADYAGTPRDPSKVL